MATEGTFVLADIGGYTSFVTAVGIEHAKDEYPDVGAFDYAYGDLEPVRRQTEERQRFFLRPETPVLWSARRSRRRCWGESCGRWQGG